MQPLVLVIAGAMMTLTLERTDAHRFADQDRPTFRAMGEAVRVDVSVREGTKPVRDLTAKDFELLDNGVAQQIADVSYETVPIDVTVGLDISQSVSGALLEQLRQSVRDLRGDLRASDRLKLLSFNMRVLRETEFIADRRRIETALAGLAASGSTAVFDTIAVSLVATAAPDRRHLVMLFTDGDDTNSFTHTQTLVEVAQRTNAALGFVLGGASTQLAFSSRLPFRSPPMLALLASETGGQVVPVAMGEDLGSTFRRILGEFRSSYVLSFRPTGVDRAGFHKLEVRVPRSDKYEIRARRGYFGS